MTFSPDDDDRLWRESQQEGWFHFSSPLRYVVFLIILLCVIIGLWYLFSSAHQSYNKTDLALIRADETPFKVKAKDQGLPNVKHQDKLVYGRIRKDQDEPPVEHILPDPEPPLAHIKDDTPSLKMVTQFTPEEIQLEKGEDIASEPNHKATPSLASIEDLIEEQIINEKTVGKKKEVKGNILIQLGSLKSYDMAESEWIRISKKHKDILGNLQSTIQKVDLGNDQGIYYRLRIGPFENTEKAKEVCAKLKERKVDCLVLQ